MSSLPILRDYLEQQAFSQEQVESALFQFEQYRDLLLLRNSQFNLTAITDPAEIETKHFIDSLLARPYIRGRVLDIGAGAGFPSLPLKIVCEANPFTLVDALSKRIGFLQEVIDLLQLHAVQALHARAEDLPKSDLYDTVVARAVAPLSVLSEYCLPFVSIGGLFIAYKSYDCDEEVQTATHAIQVLGGAVESVCSVPLFGTDIQRKLVLVRKVKPTPNKYPRQAGKPKKNPL